MQQLVLKKPLCFCTFLEDLCISESFIFFLFWSAAESDDSWKAFLVWNRKWDQFKVFPSLHLWFNPACLGSFLQLYVWCLHMQLHQEPFLYLSCTPVHCWNHCEFVVGSLSLASSAWMCLMRTSKLIWRLVYLVVLSVRRWKQTTRWRTRETVRSVCLEQKKQPQREPEEAGFMRKFGNVCWV